MPTIGERRSGATETVEWNGQRWEPIETQQAAEPLDALLKRADALTAGNAPVDVSQNPRVQAANALQDPGQGTYFRDHPTEAHASQDDPTARFASNFAQTANPLNTLLGLKAMVPGTDANRAALEASAREQETHPVNAALRSMFPMLGGAGIGAGSKMAAGDVAGGLGELTGDITNVAAPEIIGKGAPLVGRGLVEGTGAVGRGVSKLGAAAERLGTRAAESRAGNLGPLGVGGFEAAMGHPVAGAATAAAPYVVKYTGKGMQAVGDAMQALRDNVAKRFDWSTDASARPEWDPAGPARRAAAEAEQEAAYGRSNDQRYAENTRARSDAAGNSAAPLADQMEGVMRGVPDEFGSRAESMGRNTVADMQRAGYDVPDTGFTSTRDIDALGKGPDADIALQALREKAAASARTAPPTSDFFTKPQDFGPEPTQEDIIGSIDRSANEGLGRVDENADVPEFSHEARDANTPSLTIPQNALRAQQQAESLRALMNLPSFRGLR